MVVTNIGHFGIIMVILVKNNSHFGYTKLTDIEKNFHNGHFGPMKRSFWDKGYFGAKIMVILGNGHFGKRSFWYTLDLTIFDTSIVRSSEYFVRKN